MVPEGSRNAQSRTPYGWYEWLLDDVGAAALWP